MNIVNLFLVIGALFCDRGISQDIDVGEPLILTPYIQSGQLDAGQQAAKVDGINGIIESYSGYLTVNEEYNSNLWFWFFPARYNSPNAPVVLWLNGGPGASSLSGVFVENGPFSIDSHTRLHLREINWAIQFNVIYVDQPAGTGFSFTDDLKGYARNETDVGRDMYEFLVQWFQLFYQFQNNEFYITGESYAGHYIPAIGHTIYENRNEDSAKYVNVKGFAIGDGWLDPINQVNYADFLWYAGLIGDVQREYMHGVQDEIVQHITDGKYIEANYLLGEISLAFPRKSKAAATSTFVNFTGILDPYNYLYTMQPSEMNYFGSYIELPYVRRALHVGNTTFGSHLVYTFLIEDIDQSVAPWLEELLNSTLYRIMLYNGQVDVIVAHTLTTNLISHLDWYGAEDFANADRTVWRVDDVKVGGYVRTAHNFTQVIVRDAGHLVPFDQPEYALDMITRFILNTGF